jgi:hypothetical protein
VNRTVWVSRFDRISEIYGNDPFAPVAAQQGFTRVAVQAMHGGNWANAVDQSPVAVSGIGELQTLEKTFAAHGLALDAWVVPTKLTARGVEPLYFSILQSIKGRLIFDLEPYAEQWGDGSSPDEFLGEFFHTIQEQEGFAVAGGGTSRLALCYDPRQYDWLATWFIRFPVVMPMVYDKAWLSDLRAVGKPAEVILSTTKPDGTPTPAVDWWKICRDSTAWNTDGRTGFGVFRAPVLGAEHQGTLRGLQ